MAFSTNKLQLGAAAVLLAGTGAAAGVMLSDRLPTSAVPATVAAAPFAPLAASTGSLADMVEAVGPSVVQIQVKPEAAMLQQMAYGDDTQDGFGGGDQQQGAGSLEDRLRELFGDALRGRGGSQGPQGPQGPQDRQPGPQQGGALGSGFIVDASGIVVTNNHVVGNARTVTVQLSDGREFPGTVLGRDPQTDVAVVRIDGKGASFKPVTWGDSDRARVGDSVFAVGSPFGLGNTVTAGIVSARGREIGAGPYDDFLQVDAAINSGNSGGPLFDAHGRVVGVNTAIYSPSGGNVGIGFAIPAHMVQRVAQAIVANGHVARGKIGVMLQGLTPDIARAMNLEETKGALIAQVDGAGTAARSGLRQGDIVRAFGNTPIDDSRDLARAVADAKAGSKVPVAVVRDGRRVTVDLLIGGEAA